MIDNREEKGLWSLFLNKPTERGTTTGKIHHRGSTTGRLAPSPYSYGVDGATTFHLSK